MSSRTRSCRSKEGALDKRYCCMHPGCFKTFTRKEHLQRHKLNHQQLPGWPCSACDKSFYRFDLLQRHSLAHHGAKLAKPHQESIATPSPSSNVSALKKTTDIEWPWLGPNVAQENAISNSNFGGISASPASTNTPNGGTAEPSIMHSQELPIAHGFSGDNGSSRANNGIHPLYMSPISFEGLEWLFDYNSMAQCGTFNQQNQLPFTLGHNATANDLASFEACFSSPISEPEVLIPLEKIISHRPECNFKVCHALTEEHRTQLLWSLRAALPSLDIDSPLLSLDSLKNGLHFYFKYVSPEYSIFHRCLITHMGTHKRQILTWYGEGLSWQLLWAMIIFGWSVPSFQDASDARDLCKMGQEIHKGLRNYVLTQITLTPTPSLSLTQLLFLVLVYARYHGPEDSSGFAIILHGVLVDNVRKFECHDTDIPESWKLDDPMCGEEEWFKWMKRESLKRVIFQTFVLDVQRTVLHGSDMRMSPFELDYSLPCEDELWFAESVDDWREVYLKRKHDEDARGSYNYLTLLKKFWNHAPAIFSTIQAGAGQAGTELHDMHKTPEQGQSHGKTPAFAFSRGSRIVMYGVLAIAWDIRQRSDTRLFHFVERHQSFRGKAPPKGDWTSTELSSHVEKSVEDWVSWWTSGIISLSLKHVAYTWRNCPCMFRLAPILYEIGPHNLQIMSGRDCLEGRRVKTSEYLSSRRKIKQWVKEDSALSGVAGAAKIIHDRLSPGFAPSNHCHHCSWILYLAGLVCWVYGFALQNGWHTNLENSSAVERHEPSARPSILDADPGLARAACDAYLRDTVHASSQKTSSDGSIVAHKTLLENLQHTKGVLIVLAEILGKENEVRGSWLINEAMESIKVLLKR